MARRRAVSEPAARCSRGLPACLFADDAALAALSAAFPVVWQVFLREWDMWKDFSLDQSRHLEAAWDAMDHRVFVDDGDWHDRWLVDFGRMTQTSMHTGTRRAIRRVCVTHH